MDRRRRSSLVGGILLILIGAWFIAVQFMPGLKEWLQFEVSWPLFMIAAGVILFVAALVTAVPGLAVPASIVGGIGGILYWQTTTGRWETWGYVWPLIISFVGVGVLLSNILEGRTGKGLREGGWPTLIGLVLFLVLGSLLGGPGWPEPYWPLLGLGLFLVVHGLLRLRR